MKNAKVSIITVSYNSVATIEQTIKSVVNQTYLNREYIVIDGGSTDGTLDIIHKYEAYISYWCSEQDFGIYHAMNKGIEKATGDIVAFLNSDDYYIDEEKRKVLLDQKEIELTTKEYELLLYFIKNKGIAISREQVLSKVWDENYFGSDRVVDDTLRRLRKKMPNINIKTIYGFGYRLD